MKNFDQVIRSPKSPVLQDTQSKVLDLVTRIFIFNVTQSLALEEQFVSAI